MACSSARLSRKRSWYSCSSSSSVPRPARLAAGLGGAEVQQLTGVVPVVDGLRCVDALVALQPDELAAGPAAEHLGHLGLADAGLALEQQRPLQRQRQEHRRGQALVGQVAVQAERLRRRRRGEVGVTAIARQARADAMLSTWYTASPCTLRSARPRSSARSRQGCHTLDRRPTTVIGATTRRGDGGTVTAEAATDGDTYWFVVDGVGPLLDPDRDGPRRSRRDGPRSVIRARVAEASVARALTTTIRSSTSCTCVGSAGRSPAASSTSTDLADLGVNVIELMPVHPFDPERQLLGVHAAGVGRRAPAVCSRRRCAGASWPTLVAAAHAHGHRGVARRRVQPHRRGRRDHADAVAARPRRRQRLPSSRRRLVQRRQWLRQRRQPGRPARSAAGDRRRSTDSPTSESMVSASTSPRC